MCCKYYIQYNILISALRFQIKAVNYTDEIQAEISRGEEALNAVFDRTVLLDIQHALRQMRIAQTSAVSIDRFHEMLTLTKLFEEQYAEIKRVASTLKGLNAETCSLSATLQANRIVSNSKSVHAVNIVRILKRRRGYIT